MTTPDGAPCTQPGCSGGMEGGYCNECGHAATSAPLASMPSARPLTGQAVPPPQQGRPPATAASMRMSTTGGPVSGVSGSRPSRRGTAASSPTAGTASGRLGGGMVNVPPVPQPDPAATLMRDPQVPERRRFCGNSACGKPVGRGRDGRQGRAEGFCPHCGTPFSFRPKLTPGMLVKGQYEVQGCLAHGGLGWIYLAKDREVSDRWVVLKGLLDSGDADAMAAAKAEAEFLARIKHPSIVTIINFAQHPGTGGTSDGYIVMEYVGGSSLKQLIESNRNADGSLRPMPVSQVIAYALEILPGLGYLHAQGLAFCDFKPENVIQYDRQLKLIDLGAVIRMDDQESPVYGTIGYQAPEIRELGPSPASDIHTVGRTMAVLALALPPAQSGRITPLPTPAESPVFAAHESFYRLLCRATDPDPSRRFGSTDEMADQLIGVLREVLAVETGRTRPHSSTIFGAPRGDFAPDLLDEDPSTAGGMPGRPDPRTVANRLPDPAVGVDDPATSVLATATTFDIADAWRILKNAAPPAVEPHLILLRAHLVAGEPGEAARVLDRIAQNNLDDWRREWFRGLIALTAGRPAEALVSFDTVYATLPGEVAPKLALAAAAECAGNDAVAAHLYAQVARPDPSIADAGFGLARVRLRAGDPVGAVNALDAIPETSNRYVAARLAGVRVILLGRANARVVEADLRTAAERAQRLQLAPATELAVRAELLEPAVALAPSNGAGMPFLGTPWNERELRFALERCLRSAARHTSDRDERASLVDRANAVRPLTWI